MSATPRTVLWWGRFDPDYSRNRILRQGYGKLGWQVVDFHPLLSPIGDLEANLRQLPRANLIHVPCFRQRDLAAAARYARRHRLPLLFDPLISAYDKQVFERAKFAENSATARRLKSSESGLFARANLVLADTDAHARFYSESLGIARDHVQVVYVGAEEALFKPDATPRALNDPLEVLFYGSFIALQGAEVIVEAARLYQGPPVRWVLLGDGPLRAACEQLAAGLPNLKFENWLPYEKLPDRIRRADILLGVFGATPKAQRVIPNKVFQALACGKPLVTCSAPAYPEPLRASAQSGLTWVPPGDPERLAAAVRDLAQHPGALATHGAAALATHHRFFSEQKIREQLAAALAAVTAGK